VEGSFTKQALGKEVVPYEYSLVTKDGKRVDAILSTRLIPYERDNAILGTVTDVSELKRAEAALQQRNRELELLNHVGRVFGSTLDLDRILTTVLEETRQTLNATACSVWLTDPDTLELVCRQATGPYKEKVRGWRLAPGEGIASWVASTGESLNVSDVRTNGRHFKGVDHQTGLDLRSILSIPLLLRDEVIGVLQIADSEVGRFDDTDMALLEPLAATAATAIENARLYEQARQDAAIKSVLLQEVNHRVKNNLSAIIGLLRTAKRRVGPEDGSGYEAVMGELTNLVQGLAIVHDLLSASEWSPLLLSELADQIIRSSLGTLSQDERVRIDVSQSSVRVTPDQAHNLTLIINELTTNAVKHALAGRERVHINISIGLQDDVVVFEFRDDGPGYSEEALQLKATCIGLDLVQKITRRSLLGHLSLHNDHGAVTTIRFRTKTEMAEEFAE
jgi:two-component sensor histidine kinase